MSYMQPPHGFQISGNASCHNVSSSGGPSYTQASSASQDTTSDWQEFTAIVGRRCYYNKRTKQSSWEKPSELMTPLEQASSASQDTTSNWQEFIATDGQRYYYNKRTKQSSWEKPLELMTPLERADASTVWKEFTTSEGKKYYYNKDTKQSQWTIPYELKLARELVEKEASRGTQSPATSISSHFNTLHI